MKRNDDLLSLKLELATIQRKDNDPHALLGCFSAIELETDMQTLLQEAQRQCFHKEIQALTKGQRISNKSNLLRLTPFLDEDGIIKVGGRLGLAHLPSTTKHPTILDADHHLTDLIVAYIHRGAGHPGVERTLSEVRSSYWILKRRRAIRRVIYKCIICRKARAQPCVPLMAVLPKERLKPHTHPFAYTGIDYFGPMTVVIGRRREKRYGCLFTCLNTRAVHIEPTHTLNADSFLMAFRRFIALRGTPNTIFSDNGTNLVAGEKEIREGIANLNSQQVANEIVDHIGEQNTV